MSKIVKLIERFKTVPKNFT